MTPTVSEIVESPEFQEFQRKNIERMKRLEQDGRAGTLVAPESVNEHEERNDKLIALIQFCWDNNFLIMFTYADDVHEVVLELIDREIYGEENIRNYVSSFDKSED